MNLSSEKTRSKCNFFLRCRDRYTANKVITIIDEFDAPKCKGYLPHQFVNYSTFYGTLMGENLPKIPAREVLEQLFHKNGISPTIQYSIIEWRPLANSIFMKFSICGYVSKVVQRLKSNGLKYPLGKIQLVHELYRKNRLVQPQ